VYALPCGKACPGAGNLFPWANMATVYATTQGGPAGRQPDGHHAALRHRRNELFWPLVVVNSPSMKVVTLGLLSFTSMYFIEYNLVTAAAVLSIAPILIVFLVGQKWVVRGVIMSGLKG
jgi:hypothetical protein